MNGFSLIKPDSAIHTLGSKELLVYSFFIADVRKEDDALISSREEYEVSERLSFIDAQDAEHVTNYLEKKGLISIKRGIVYVGTCVDNQKNLFSGNVVDLSNEFKLLVRKARAYSRTALSPVTSSHAKRMGIAIETFSEKELSKLTVKDFYAMYNMAYTVIEQAEPREFTGKEWGQLKQFMGLYDKATALKVMLNYMLYYEKFGKTLSLGSMIFYKDDVMATINKTVKTRSYGSESTGEGF